MRRPSIFSSAQGRGRNPSSLYGIFLLVMVNVLNVTDAILTHFWVGSGYAVELNPVASAIGMPGKLVLVAVASYLLYRIRPRALVWPTMALALVVGYIGLATLVALVP